MIPRAHIIEWQQNAPWKTNAQIEQDLVICRALIAIFSDEFLASSLAFRGGTALHKLYLHPQPRYSEDIDLVQIRPEPIKETIKRLQKQLSFIDAKSVVDPRKNNNTIKFRFDSEFTPVLHLRVKVEINCREHFTILDYQKFPFDLKSSWFNGSCSITTYKLEELLGTKLRALYQRRKGRDLYDMYKALIQVPELNRQELLQCYKEYMKFVVDKPPTQKQFIQNMEAKMLDDEFLGDTTALIRPDEKYNPMEAYDLVKNQLIDKI
jgi:predicted nucleotidyltransferase component of viral defense system